MSYPGGKNGAGVFQTIINHIPPHDVYIEPFAGGAAIFRNKRRAPASFLIDTDFDAFSALQGFQGRDTMVLCGNGLSFLKTGVNYTQRTFIYADPPYVMDSRKSQRAIYSNEWNDQDHREFLVLAKTLPCSIAISGYASDLYFDELAAWECISFTAQTRQGPATEYLWMNYPKPVVLHDCRYLGNDYRERERIKRKAQRWADNFASWEPLEQQAVLSAMMERAESCTVVSGEGIAPTEMAIAPGTTTSHDDGCRNASPETAVGSRTADRGTPDAAVPDGADAFDHDLSAGWPRGQHG